MVVVSAPNPDLHTEGLRALAPPAFRRKFEITDGGTKATRLLTVRALGRDRAELRDETVGPTTSVTLVSRRVRAI